MCSMAVSSSTNRWLFISSLTCIFVFAGKFPTGRAFEYPHLGAAGVIAQEYLPQAEVEGETDQFIPQAGIIATGPAIIFNKALECLTDKHIYSGCDEPHRLTQSGELNVPPEYTDEYCKGPCLIETHHALDCIAGFLKNFVFYNKAKLEALRKTIDTGCSYGPKRGNFDVLEHIQADDATATKVFNPLLHGITLIMVGWRLLL